jgi:GNAT superfamily N-acetyltransferase
MRGGFMEILIREAGQPDLAEVLALQKVCYYQEAELNHDFMLPPLLQTIEEIAEDFDSQKILKAVLGSRIIGSVRAYEKNGSCYIGKLLVRPDHQNQGLGRQLMNMIEKLFTVKRYELFTGSGSVKNLYLYNKLGYREFKREKTGNSYDLVYLEKNTGGAL